MTAVSRAGHDLITSFVVGKPPHTMRLALALALGLGVCTGCRFGFDEQPIAGGDAALTDVARDARIVTKTFGERPGSMTTGVTTDATVSEGMTMMNFDPFEDLSISDLIERGLLRFDVSSIAPGTVVVACRLELERVDYGDDITGGLALREVGQAWVEGNVTWNVRDTGTAWTAAGGTVSSPIVTLGPPPLAVSFTVPPSTPQRWIDTPATNFGLALSVADEQSPTHYHMHSSESVVLTARPQLVLDLAL